MNHLCFLAKHWKIRCCRMATLGRLRYETSEKGGFYYLIGINSYSTHIRKPSIPEFFKLTGALQQSPWVYNICIQCNFSRETVRLLMNVKSVIFHFTHSNTTIHIPVIDKWNRFRFDANTFDEQQQQHMADAPICWCLLLRYAEKISIAEAKSICKYCVE